MPLPPRRQESMAAQNDLPEVQLDLQALYREDVFTDRRAGSIRRLTPVTADGSVDPTRPVLFSGQTQLLTPAGVVALGVGIEAGTLGGGVKEIPGGGRGARRQAGAEARALRPGAAARLVAARGGAAG